MIKKFFLLSGLTLATVAFSQTTHTVVKGDTPYNISKKYGISIDDLYRLNPQVKNGVINLGDILTVNAKSGVQKTQVVSAAGSATTKIILQPKQTLYGLTKQYHITEAEIRKLNPDLQMQIGEEITLPAANVSKYGGNVVVATTNTVDVPKPETQASAEKGEAASADDFHYEVQDKDNYYRITRKFGITKSQLFMMNPGLEEKGLKKGDIIKVKATDVKETVANQIEDSAGKAQVTTVETSSVATAPGDQYVTYTVQSGDTVFGIVNKYGVTLDQLLSLNPDLVYGLKSGMVLKIKKLDEGYVKKSGDALNVILMLPFGFDSNDSKYRNMAADFLSGARLAIERNASEGLKMDIKIVDAGNEKSFKNSLTQINQDNTDLIIGPFFKSNIIEVLDFVHDKKIPVVAPFANSDDLYGYSNLVIMETADQVYADGIAKEIAKKYSNEKIYILSDKDPALAEYLKTKLEKTLKKPEVHIVASAADIQADTNMMTGQSAPVVAVLASNDDALGKAFTGRVVELAEQVAGTRAYSLFYTPSFDSDTNGLSAAALVYLMDRKVNTDGSFEKEILADYKKKYCKVPPRFAIIGFDTVNDILSRENKKGEVLKQMGKTQTQLATKFEYARPRSGGAYVNTGYRIVRPIPEN